jgi:hypothetical protein
MAGSGMLGYDGSSAALSSLGGAALVLEPHPPANFARGFSPHTEDFAEVDVTTIEYLLIGTDRTLMLGVLPR